MKQKLEEIFYEVGQKRYEELCSKADTIYARTEKPSLPMNEFITNTIIHLYNQERKTQTSNPNALNKERYY